jgi:hypothetical protein
MLTVHTMQTLMALLLNTCSRKVGAHIKSAVGNAAEKCAEKCVLISIYTALIATTNQLCVCIGTHLIHRLLHRHQHIPWQYRCTVSCSAVKSCIVKTPGVCS